MKKRVLIMPRLARIRELLDYDPLTGIFRWKSKPDGHRAKYVAGEIAGSIDKDGYRVICIDYAVYRAHRLAWAMFHDEEPPDYPDHRNLNCDDNRIENLREATNQGNMANGRRRKNNSSGFKGVYWNKKLSKWNACIRVNGTTKWLGSFTTVELAAAAYAGAASQNFGEFARAA